MYSWCVVSILISGMLTGLPEPVQPACPVYVQKSLSNRTAQTKHTEEVVV